MASGYANSKDFKSKKKKKCPKTSNVIMLVLPADAFLSNDKKAMPITQIKKDCRLLLSQRIVTINS